MGLSIEVWGIILGVVSIALALYFGAKPLTSLMSKRTTQNQKAEPNSVAIQSGRDTKVGK